MGPVTIVIVFNRHLRLVPREMVCEPTDDFSSWRPETRYDFLEAESLVEVLLGDMVDAVKYQRQGADEGSIHIEEYSSEGLANFPRRWDRTFIVW